MKKILATLGLVTVTASLALAQYVPALSAPIQTSDEQYAIKTWNAANPTNVWVAGSNAVYLFTNDVSLRLPRDAAVGVWLTYSNGPSADGLTIDTNISFVLQDSPGSGIWSSNEHLVTMQTFTYTSGWCTAFCGFTNAPGVRQVRLVKMTNAMHFPMTIRRIVCAWFYDNPSTH